MTFKINYKEEDCIGCGACAALCPENWELKDGKAKPKKTTLTEVGCNQDAADSCPMSCINIEEQ